VGFVQKIEADKLFNLFSNYGNIVRIKILHNKPDHALIQMGDGFQAELAFNYLKVREMLKWLLVWGMSLV
jgi:polypyrimidine tract-binding protein 2